MFKAAYNLAAKPGWPHRRAMFGPLVAPPVLVMQGKESRIAEIEPEHIDCLVQVELLAQGARSIRRWAIGTNALYGVGEIADDPKPW